ncbi:dUTPase-like protein [Obelidium mucronatum]|nr:dUTPase-like protein [Obelidium mucronatum]
MSPLTRAQRRNGAAELARNLIPGVPNDYFLVKRVHPSARLPEKMSIMAAGYDVYSTCVLIIAPGSQIRVSTGLQMQFPEGMYGRILSKPGNAIRHDLIAVGGVIDGSFRGTVSVVLVNLGDKPVRLGMGHPIAQVVIRKLESPQVLEVLDI